MSINPPLPREYLQEWTPIQSLEVHVPHGLFIPRIETEEWVQESFALFEADTKLVFIDLCSGTGLISLLLAQHYPENTIIALDKNPLSPPTIRRNAMRNNLDMIQVYESDFFANCPILQSPWILYCNPPYVPDEDRQLLIQNNIAYEPINAIFGGGQDGLDFFRQALVEIKTLPPPKLAFFELDPRNILAATELATTALHPQSTKILVDRNGFQRTLVLLF